MSIKVEREAVAGTFQMQIFPPWEAVKLTEDLPHIFTIANGADGTPNSNWYGTVNINVVQAMGLEHGRDGMELFADEKGMYFWVKGLGDRPVYLVSAVK
jgi:hypothetical protein